MQIPSPGRVYASMARWMPCTMSAIATIRSGATSHPGKRRAANAANASGRPLAGSFGE